MAKHSEALHKYDDIHARHPPCLPRPTHGQIVRTARKLYGQDGTDLVQIEAGAKIKRPPGNPQQGAFVQAWVWVSDNEARDGG